MQSFDAVFVASFFTTSKAANGRPLAPASRALRSRTEERAGSAGVVFIRAGREGAHELVGPVIAMTITLAAVYAPIGLQSGVTGALFREFALTLAGAVAVSGLVALTLSPMMCSRLLKPHDPSQKSWDTGLVLFLDRAFEAELKDKLHTELEVVKLAIKALEQGASVHIVYDALSLWHDRNLIN